MTIDESVDAVRTEYNSLASSLATLEQATILLAEMGNDHLRDVNAWKLKELHIEGIRVTRRAIEEGKNRLILAVGEFLKTIGRGG